MTCKAKQGLVGELNIPFHSLPALIGTPPIAREGERPIESDDGTWAGAIQKCKGTGVPCAGVTGNMDRKWWAIATQRQSGSGVSRAERPRGISVRFPAWLRIPAREQGFFHPERIWIMTGKRKGHTQAVWPEKRR